MTFFLSILLLSAGIIIIKQQKEISELKEYVKRLRMQGEM